jgi:cytochrome oxidase Cu insertion factor (SCO1/SenC/PrrC family)
MRLLSFAFLLTASMCFAESSAPKEAKPVDLNIKSIAGDGAPSCPDCAAGLVPAVPSSTVTDWLDTAKREKIDLDFALTTQASKKSHLKDLVDKPTAITFFYTRCENPRKCPLAVATMASLAEKLKTAGLLDKVRLLVFTYDPTFDTPEVVQAYAKQKGLTFSENVLMLCPEAKDKEKLFDSLKASVNYNAKGVNIHSLQLHLLDSKGQLARTYHSVIWDNEKVKDDLIRLIEESKIK